MVCRSMRGSRPGSLKTKTGNNVKENGDISQLGVTNVGNRFRNDEFDIKVWQQKKQQAEIKRQVSNVQSWLDGLQSK